MAHRRPHKRAALESLGGFAWIAAVAIGALGLFRSKKTSLDEGAPPPPPPPPPATPPEGRGVHRLQIPAKETRRAFKQRWALPVWATLTAAALALGLPLPSVGLSLFERAPEEPRGPYFTATSAGVETTQSAASLMRFRQRVFEARPEPEPEPEPEPVVEAAPAPAAEAAPPPPPPPVPAGSVQEIIHAAAARHGVDGAWMVRIAQCESGLNPRAVNPAGYYGLFQFSQSTWAAYGSGDIFDAAAQSEATAKMLAAGGAGHWPHCQHA